MGLIKSIRYLLALILRTFSAVAKVVAAKRPIVAKNGVE